jgi:hypothetical protein
VDMAPGAMLCSAGRRRHKATARFGRRLADMLERRFPGWAVQVRWGDMAG